MAVPADTKEIQAIVTQDTTTVEFGSTKIMVSPASQVTFISNELTVKDVRRKPIAAGTAFSTQLDIVDNGFSVNGIKVEFMPYRRFIVHANDEVQIRPEVTPEIGQEMKDGSFYVGLTEDGKQQIFVMAEGLRKKAYFDQTQEAIRNLNADKEANHGHSDWQIGSVDVIQLVHKSWTTGALKTSFKKYAHADRSYARRPTTRAFSCWTSTQNPKYPNSVATVTFVEEHPYTRREVLRWRLYNLKQRLKTAFDGKRKYPTAPTPWGVRIGKDGEVRSLAKNSVPISCRPVRLVPVPSV